MDYKNAGVDIEAGYKSVELMKEHVKKTMREEVLGEIWADFPVHFPWTKIQRAWKIRFSYPVPTAVGTKVKLAIYHGQARHRSVSTRVAMCVNDIACAGGEPLFFLDYIACGKNYPEKIADIVKGVAEGCLQSEAALIGGETAEHAGAVCRRKSMIWLVLLLAWLIKKIMITGENLKAGDVLDRNGIHRRSQQRFLPGPQGIREGTQQRGTGDLL